MRFIDIIIIHIIGDQRIYMHNIVKSNIDYLLRDILMDNIKIKNKLSNNHHIK